MRQQVNSRVVPEQFSRGGDQTNAQKAWLDGFDAGRHAALTEVIRLLQIDNGATLKTLFELRDGN